ncbi:phenylacetate--CoA ligase family protein [Cellulomonas sp. PhB150]|uniref:phenylacetate--CoA ligase family protein n=1 Tax=Cellulomonas sp. PhB150 TaxID=2485188 RepID=UPI000F48FA1D|nr:phenylacetate--CoA ligase family protein [Cellulomonas sp. PhB150]ROS22984.1 phenylacetate-CoA ligase [Cellulomonas sp. PhB150]
MDTKHAILMAKSRTISPADGRMYANLLAHERLSPPDLAELQRVRGARLATYAWDTTDFYRDHYSSAGLSRQDVADPEAFEHLPTVEKEHLRDGSARFHARDVAQRDTKMASTGGSTGEPVRLLHDRRVPVRTISWRLLRWWGVEASDDVAHVYRHVRSPRREILHTLQWWPSRSIQIDAYRMDSAALETFFRRFRRVRPRLVLGYVGGIYELACHIEEHGIALPPVAAVGVTAAPLSEVQRSTIERVFGAPAFDHYRCGEVPWIAGECGAHRGLHSFGDVRLVEVVDDGGRRLPAGVIGDTVVTDLTNRAFPLVRYRLGDRSAMIATPCPCGVTLPLMEHVRGRVSDALHLPDGQIVAGEGLTAIFDDWPEAVRAFQVYQHADASISLRYVVGSDPRAEEIVAHVRDVVRSMVRDKVPVATELVDSIPHDGGKTRYIVSELRSVAPVRA